MFHMEFRKSVFAAPPLRLPCARPCPEGSGISMPRGGEGLEAPRHLSGGDCRVSLMHLHSYSYLCPWPKQQFPRFI